MVCILDIGHCRLGHCINTHCFVGVMGIKTWPEFKEDFIEAFSWTNIKRFGWGWFFKKVENLLDDPIDYVKEALHGMHLPCGYELNISFLMRNRETSWDIIRKQGSYSNEDPEDL